MAELTALAAVKRAGGSNEPCNRFSAAMKSWGRYELVAAPAEALKYASALELQIWEKPRFMNPGWDCYSLTARHTSYCGRCESPRKVHCENLLGRKTCIKGMENLLAEITKLAGTPLSAGVDGPQPESAQQTS